MWGVLCCLSVCAALSVLHVGAVDEDFCLRPANMDLCWFNNNYKRYLRFGRGDPFLRFGRSKVESWRFNPFNHFGGKRAAESTDTLANYLENGGYLRFGRSLAQSPASPILALLSVPSEGSQVSRKRRDVTSVSSELHRSSRDIKDGGFLRFGRPSLFNGNAEQAKQNPPLDKRNNAVNLDLPNGDREYLRFGRSHFQGSLPGFGKRMYLRFGRTVPEGYLRFGKRSAETV